MVPFERGSSHGFFFMFTWFHMVLLATVTSDLLIMDLNLHLVDFFLRLLRVYNKVVLKANMAAHLISCIKTKTN